jgi:hypothetical protein
MRDAKLPVTCSKIVSLVSYDDSAFLFSSPDIARHNTRQEFSPVSKNLFRIYLASLSFSVDITFVTKDSIDGPAKTTVQRGVLGSMTVRNVKNLVQKLLRVPAMRQELLFMAEDPVYAGVMVGIFRFMFS